MTDKRTLRSQALHEERDCNPIPLSPCAYQTPKEIEAYYRTAPVGAQAVIRQTQGHILLYTLCTIEGRNPARGRVCVTVHGAFYMKSGANCFHPKGQTSLVAPTPEVIAWAAANPRGQSGISIFPPEKSFWR